jgi:hypothetical protein
MGTINDSFTSYRSIFPTRKNINCSEVSERLVSLLLVTKSGI